MVLISSSDPDGSLFVETKNLDGETNLKLKSLPKQLAKKPISDYANFTTVIECDKPNNLIYKFEGTMKLQDDQPKFPLFPDQVALRGMSLKNTEEVVGVIVYTGHETKIQMNTQNATYKISNLLHQTNK